MGTFPEVKGIEGQKDSEKYKIFFRNVDRFRGSFDLLELLLEQGLDDRVAKFAIRNLTQNVGQLMLEIKNFMRSFDKRFNGEEGFDEKAFVAENCTEAPPAREIRTFAQLRNSVEEALRFVNFDDLVAVPDVVERYDPMYSKVMGRARSHFKELSYVREALKYFLKMNYPHGD